MKIVIGKNPMDVKILDDCGQKIDLAIRRLTLNLEGGTIPTALIEIELFRETEIEIAELDLITRIDTLRKKDDTDEDLHSDT